MKNKIYVFVIIILLFYKLIMSSFYGYSKSKNNVFQFTDDQIAHLYKAAEKEIDGGNGVGYFLHVPKTNHDFHNINFMMDSCVNIANNYFITNFR